MCDMDCFHCGKPDCDNEEITTAERKEQNERDQFAIYDRKDVKGQHYSDRAKKYWQSERGKAVKRRYNSSEKGKARYKKYMQSEKGKEIARRQSQKAVASGKNAERCRAYYQRKKERMFRELMERGAE